MNDYRKVSRQEAEIIKKQQQEKYSDTGKQVRLTRNEIEELERRRSEMKRRSLEMAGGSYPADQHGNEAGNNSSESIRHESGVNYSGNANLGNDVSYQQFERNRRQYNERPHQYEQNRRQYYDSSEQFEMGTQKHESSNLQHVQNHQQFEQNRQKHEQSRRQLETVRQQHEQSRRQLETVRQQHEQNHRQFEKERQQQEQNRPQYDKYPQQPETGRKQYDRNRKKRSFGKTILAILLVIAILAAVVFGYAFMKIGKLDYQKVAGITNGEDTGDYTNIALFGVDSREGEITSGVNSDTIIIASINNRTKETKLVSVYRDTYLRVDDYDYGKANSAYCYGGAVQAVNMLNSNLDMDIECFMTVNFSALVSVIDILGGLDIDMTAEEVVWMNGYIAETSEATGIWSETQDDQIWDGVHHLNGIQATSYCRIRYTEGYDFRRTERQRLVLSEIIKKMKRQPWKLNKIMNEVFPQVYTNINSGKLMKMGLSLFEYKLSDTSGFPYEMNPDWTDDYGQSQVVPIGLSENVVKLHQYLFPDQDYHVSDTLQQISNDIIWITGEDPEYY